jgi:hypothetical protein
MSKRNTISSAQMAALRRIKTMSKGWPVGIPIKKRTAMALYRIGLVEWAPGMWTYDLPVYTCRLTAAGALTLEGKI